MEPRRRSGRRHGMRSTPIPVLLALFALQAVVVACGPGAAGSPSPAITVGTPEQAAAAVAERTPLFDAIGPQDPNVIGASQWWTATPFGTKQPPDAWTVTFRIGWGDCQAGCIDEHTWTWLVEQDGTLDFQGETGAPLPDDLYQAQLAAARGTGIGGRVTAGPRCPVEQPGNPDCAPRPVGGAILVVTDAAGAEVARTTTDGSGLYRIALKPGDYTVTPQPVDGLMGTPAPETATVQPQGLTALDISYDTGIR